ncbi:polycystic kidney disease 2-like 1 protein [Eupeodes corollae]|uniref:polycystic kidney disease 2-like 1 protein n=1 Tax=Eupeodes corollae TaxID=290404 RepID=UPI0024923C42|nr:polycystic kidney disease 2-like 1 protein [Eupeodes corollae]
MIFAHKKYDKSLLFSLVISLISIILLSCSLYYTGLRYESKKLKAFLTTLVLVFIYQIFIGDIIFFFLKSTYNAIRLNSPHIEDTSPNAVGSPYRKEHLLIKIKALNYQLQLGPTFFKRNQELTLKYKDILSDLILYGFYLTLLLILVIGTRDPLMYYNTRTVKDVLRNPKFGHFGTRSILTSDDLYTFINETIVNGFLDGKSYNGERFPESGWTNLQIAKLLGVVRLRQMRHKHLKEKSSFDNKIHGPGWLKANSLPFKDKFWRIFKPWEYQDKKETGGLDTSGRLHKITGSGYVTLLGRNPGNCQRVLTFLQSNNWIDSHTAVVVIEFVLYNVDANVFTLVAITAEQTGFGSFVVSDRIESLKLLFNIDNLSSSVILTFLLYFFILTRIFADLVSKVWHSNSIIKDFLSSIWNHVDMTIVGLNICIALAIWIREVYVKHLLNMLETSRKNDYVPFNRAANIDETCTVLVALLMALTTLRLWKILQFAKVFRVLTSTLYYAKKELLSTTFFVTIFLTAVGLGMYIINGTSSPSFVQFITTITTLMSLSFGFGTTIHTSDMKYGGSLVGFIFYAMLVTVVTLFLVNMFITVVCLQFSKEREKDFMNSENRDNYTFWQFVKMEFEEYFQLKMLKKEYYGGRKLSNVELKASDHVRRMELIADILETQMKLLEERIFI